MGDEPIDSKPQVGPGYALFQISKSLLTVDGHEDAEVRSRATKKIEKWLRVIGGMDSGEIAVGSRTPVSGTPEWATLEVVTGGFATGALLAGGEILAHERHLADRVAEGIPDEQVRATLNTYFISEDGIAEISELLDTGLYKVGVPEEGALLLVGWLLRSGHSELAREIIGGISGYFDRLRFYPLPADVPLRSGAIVHLESVGRVSTRLECIPINKSIEAQREAIEVWAPLQDQFVSLFLETIEGEVPTLVEPQFSGGRGTAKGGWPCRIIPEGWVDRARELLKAYDRLRQDHQKCSKPTRKKGSFSLLRVFAQKAVQTNGKLAEGDLSRLRLVLAGCIFKRGIPGGEPHLALRTSQQRQTAAPTFHSIANRVLLQRLSSFPENSGLAEVDSLAVPVTEEESATASIPVGTDIPHTLRNKVERALERSLETLIELGIVTSGDTLARLLPQITSTLRAQNISDRSLRSLYAAIYRAFRERRSLLLLNLENQVQIEELPWIAAIDQFREKSVETEDASRLALVEVVALTLSSFPQAILPNKLLQEMRALAKGAEVEMPFVEEVAADIFMGTFSPKYTAAAKIAAEMLQGSLYERYYGIDFAEVCALDEPGRKRRKGLLGFGGRSAASDSFAEICARRAGVKIGGWDVVANGMVLEQQQILTTQNLALAFTRLDLKSVLDGQLEDMAWRCLQWICRRHAMKIECRHAKLIMLKNTAYAWRQMVFYLSISPDAERAALVLLGRQAELAEKYGDVMRRLRPALEGLEASAKGGVASDRQCFLGWTKGSHWMLDGR